MNLFRSLVFFLILAAYPSLLVKAQDTVHIVHPSDTLRLGNHGDTLTIVATSDTLKVKAVTDTLSRFYKHSPTRAAVLSAVLPGMGQIYNRKYWKLPIVYGGIGTTAYFIYHFNGLYQSYLKGLIDYTRSNGDINTIKQFEAQGLNIYGNYSDITRILTNAKDAVRRYRDLNVLILAGVYFLNIIDATVDAYLFNYDISDDLSLRIQPAMLNTSPYQGAWGLKLSFSIR